MSKTWTYKELREVSKWMKEKGFMSFEEMCDVMNDHEAKRKYYWNYLEELRRSGVTNMYGAVPYLMEEFDLDKNEAREILTDWMKNYNPNDYADLK